MRACDVVRNGARIHVANTTRGLVLAERAEVAASSWRRLRGLLGRPTLGPGQGLLIRPCQGVHTLGMAYPLDVVYLDRDGVVHKVLHQLEPWRLGPLVWRASVVLELPAGAAAATTVGDRLSLEPLEPDRPASLHPR
jgi:uncharacterized membrane protein (UPF0127 family)